MQAPKHEIFILCAAATEQGGKLNILGTFSTVLAQEEPTKGLDGMLVARLRFAAGEAQTVRVKLLVRSADNSDVMPPFEKALDLPAGSDDLAFVNLLAKHRLVFPSFGTYEARLIVDDEIIATLPIRVKRRKGSPVP